MSDGDGISERKTPYWEWLYDHIETWWGEQLTFELVKKISRAPKEQLVAFSESLTRYPGSLISEPIPSGSLRPLVTESNRRTWVTADGVPLALRLLLYSPEVAIERDFLEPLYLLREPDEADESLYDQAGRALRQLVMLRPFALQGLVHLTHVFSRAMHPSHAWSGWQQELLADPEIFRLASELPRLSEADRWRIREEMGHTELVGVLSRDFSMLHFACWLAERGEVTPLARSEAEMKILSASLHRQISDHRYSTLSTLARLPVPDFSLDFQTLARLRGDGDMFEAWRKSLRDALGHVQAMPDSADMNDAAAIVHYELSSATAVLEASIKKSPFLESTKSRAANFGIGAIGAMTTGLMTGSAWAALASGATVHAADAVRHYINSINERRSDRLVLDIVSSFMPTREGI